MLSGISTVGAFVGGLFFFITGPYFLTYLLYRSALLKRAYSSQVKSPASLFAYSVLMSYFWLVATPILIFAPFFFLFKDMSTLSRSTPSALPFMGGTIGIVFLVILAIGPIGWLFLAVNRFSRAARYKAFRKMYPAPKYQIWLQDILVAAFALGVTMTLLINYRFMIPNSDAIIGVVVFQVLSQVIMFFALMDVLRYSERLKAPKARALYVLVLMLVNSVFAMPLLVALAWNVWHRAWYLAQLEEDLKAKKRNAAQAKMSKVPSPSPATGFGTTI